MKNMTKHIIIAALLTSPVWSAGEPVKPALSITPFTMKSSDGSMEIKMDDAGKLSFAGKHVASAHAEGKLTSPDGELLVKLDEKGIVLSREGNAGEDPIEITDDGTWKQGGAAVPWVDGKLDIGRGHFSITPKDSPSKRVATLCVLALAMGGPDDSLMSSETQFGPYTLIIDPAPKRTGSESRGGSKILTADKNKFELTDGEFWFNGKNYGKLPEGSRINLKRDVLTINGKESAARE
jgi:hypothetical protein